MDNENVKIQQEILERLIKIETKLDDYPNFKERTNIAYQKSNQNEKDIAEMKENNKWLSRLIIGNCITLLVGVITLVFKFFIK